jgi:hypothetical protein
MGHLWVGNHPTFFVHPMWSTLAYWKMIAATLTGTFRPVVST